MIKRYKHIMLLCLLMIMTTCSIAYGAPTLEVNTYNITVNNSNIGTPPQLEIKIVDPDAGTETVVTDVANVSSDDNTIVDVVAGNQLEYKKNGTTNLTITYNGHGTAVAVEVNITDSIVANTDTLTVTDMAVLPTLTISKYIGGVKSDVALGDADLSITSADPDIVTVNGDRTLTYKKNGNTTLTIGYAGLTSITVNVEVNIPDALETNTDTLTVTDLTSPPALTISKTVGGVKSNVDLSDTDLTITSGDSDIVTVNGDKTLTYKKNGNTALTIGYTGLTAKTVNVVVNVADVLETNTNTLTVTDMSSLPTLTISKTVGGVKSNVDLSDAALAITSGDSDIVAVNGDRTLTYKKNGNTTLTIAYGALTPVTVNVEVNIPDAIVTNTDTLTVTDAAPNPTFTISKYIGGIKTDIVNTDTELTITSDNAAVVSVTNNTLTYVGNGSATITIAYTGLTSKNVSVQVSKAAPTDTLKVNNTAINVTNSITNPAIEVKKVMGGVETVIPASDTNLTMTSSDANIVEIVNNVPNYKNNGSATITIGYPGFTSITVSVTINRVNDGLSANLYNIAVTNANPNPVLEIYKVISGTSTLIDPTDANLTITSSNTSIVEAVNNVLQYKTNGSATLTVSYPGFTSFTINVSINKVADGLHVNNSNIVVDDANPTANLIVSKVVSGTLSIVQPTDTDLTMTSNNPDSVGIVNNTLDIKKNGSAVITVSYAGLPSVNVNVKVNKTLSGDIRINTLSIAADGTDDVNIILTNATTGVVITDYANISATSSDNNVVSINSTNKKLVYNNNGSATVTIVYGGNSFVVTVTVNKPSTPPPTGEVYLQRIRITEDLDYSEDKVDLDVKAYYTDGTSEYRKSVDWSSSDRDIARVNDDGEVSFTGETGYVTIRADYHGKRDTVSTRVTKSDIIRAKEEKNRVKEEDEYVAPEDEPALKIVKISYTNNNQYNNFYNNYSGGSYKNSDIKSVELLSDLDPAKGINPLQLVVRYKNNETRIVDNKDVKYASSNQSVAKIVDNKVMYTGAVGSVVIGAEYAGYVSRETVEVKYGHVNTNPYLPNAYIPVTNNTNNNTSTAKVLQGIVINGKLDPAMVSNVFTVTVNYQNSTVTDILGPAEVYWTTSNSRVATILPGGIIQFTGKKGKVTITCEYKGKKASLYYNVR